MSTSWLGDEFLGAAVFCLNGLLASGYCFFSSRDRRRAVFSWSVGVSSVELLRGTDHGLGVVAASPMSHTVCLVFFLHVVQSALGGPLVNSFRFSRFAAQTSV